MAAVTVHSDFGGQENKVCHCFHFFPIYFHEGMGLDAIYSYMRDISFVISEEDLASGPGTRLDHSRTFVQ